MAGQLTTHVLDVHAGVPAAGVAVTLTRPGAGGVLHAARTNADGRVDGPLLAGDAFTAGEYLLEFDIGAYFATRQVAVATPAFLGIVPVRFAVADPTAHYHVPLLVSPWAYSSYRGS